MDTNKFLFRVLYPLYAIALAGIIYYGTQGFTLTQVLYLFLGWILFPGIGSAIGLHRWASHKAIEVRPFLKIPLLWAATMCLQGSTIGWAAIHRGRHHKYSDKEQDSHSPIHGYWHAYHAWLLKWNEYFSPKYAVDLIRDSAHSFFAKHYTAIIIVTYIIVGFISVEALLFMFIIPALYSLHQESMVNLFCHIRKLGYRNFDTDDNSVNVPLLGYFAWGQGWHNNHHQFASKYDFGHNKYEYDPCRLFVPLLGKAK